MPRYRIERVAREDRIFVRTRPRHFGLDNETEMKAQAGGGPSASLLNGPPPQGAPFPAPDFNAVHAMRMASAGQPQSASPQPLSVPANQVMRIYDYVVKRRSGLTPAQAAKPDHDGLQTETTAPLQEAPAPHPSMQPPPMPNEDGSQQRQSQTGSGAVVSDDDDQEVSITEDEVIRVPQGDRPKVFAHPSVILIAGASKSGKTTLVTKLMKNRHIMFSPPPEKTYWFYTMESSVASIRPILPDIKFREGVPTDDTVNSIIKARRPKLMIMDDMQDILENKAQLAMLRNILTKKSHHGNLSLIFIVQNLFQPGMLPIRRQCGDIIVMSNGTSAVGDAAQLGTSIMRSSGYLKSCMIIAKRLAHHGHLLVSSGADVGLFNVRSGITPGDPGQAFFVQKGSITTPEYIELKKHAKEGEREEEEASGR